MYRSHFLYQNVSLFRSQHNFAGALPHSPKHQIRPLLQSRSTDNFFHANIHWGYSSGFCWVPTMYVYVENKKKYIFLKLLHLSGAIQIPWSSRYDKNVHSVVASGVSYCLSFYHNYYLVLKRQESWVQTSFLGFFFFFCLIVLIKGLNKNTRLSVKLSFFFFLSSLFFSN